MAGWGPRAAAPEPAHPGEDPAEGGHPQGCVCVEKAAKEVLGFTT